MLASIALSPEHQSGWTYLIVLGTVAAIGLLLWLAGKLFPSSDVHSAAGNALMQAETFFRPSREHVIEARMAAESEDEESGDPPQPGLR